MAQPIKRVTSVSKPKKNNQKASLVSSERKHTLILISLIILSLLFAMALHQHFVAKHNGDGSLEIWLLVGLAIFVGAIGLSQRVSHPPKN